MPADTTTTASTKRSTTAKKRAGSRPTASTRRTQVRAASPLDRVGGAAEKAVLTYVGAALTARDTVVGKYGTRAKAQRQLRRFERRGATARTALEREVRNVAATVGSGRAKAERLAARVTDRVIA